MRAILHSFAYSLDYFREQVADLPAADMVAQPSGARNHPAWLLGHLTFTCQMLGGAVGLTPWLPEDFAQRFGAGSVPVADAGQYEMKEDALAMLRDAQVRITRRVEELDAAQL